MTTERNNKGGRPKLADYQKRTKMVRVMFCENDFIYLQSKAAKAGLSVGEYCHQAAMDNTGKWFRLSWQRAFATCQA